MPQQHALGVETKLFINKKKFQCLTASTASRAYFSLMLYLKQNLAIFACASVSSTNARSPPAPQVSEPESVVVVKAGWLDQVYI